jgi:hypothetical protein
MSYGFCLKRCNKCSRLWKPPPFSNISWQSDDFYYHSLIHDVTFCNVNKLYFLSHSQIFRFWMLLFRRNRNGAADVYFFWTEFVCLIHSWFCTWRLNLWVTRCRVTQLSMYSDIRVHIYNQYVLYCETLYGTYTYVTTPVKVEIAFHTIFIISPTFISLKHPLKVT